MRQMLEQVTQAVDHGAAGIVQRNVQVSLGRMSCDVRLVIERGRPNSGDRDYLHRLIYAVDSRRAELRHVRNNYDRDSYASIEIEFITDTDTMNSLENGYRQREQNGENYRTRPRAPRVNVQNISSRDPDRFIREMTEWPRQYQAVPVPPDRPDPRAAPPQRRSMDDQVDALRYAMSAYGLTNRETEEVIAERTSPDTATGQYLNALARDRGTDRRPGETDAELRQRLVSQLQGSIRGERANQIFIDDPVRISVDPAVPPGQAVVVQNGQVIGTVRNIGCRAGDPSSHQWVDVPREGPTAKRCSACARVTGQFWSPDDYRNIIVWLVDTVKPIVIAWAQSLDTSSVRFMLLELDNEKKVAEDTTSDDAVQRFALLEIER